MSDVELVACPSCGAPNHPERATCGRCRAAMSRIFAEPGEQTSVMAPVQVDVAAVDRSGDTAELDEPAGSAPTLAQPPVQSEPTAASPAHGTLARAPAAPEPADRGPSRRLVMSVGVGGIAIGAIVGLTGAGIGPFGGDDGLEAAVFDEGVYRRDAVMLGLTDVRASSELDPAGENRYEVELVLDDDPTTAWNSDGSGRPDGIGEIVDIDLLGPAWVTALEFANGYQKDDVRFLANARVARALVRFDGGAQVAIVLLDQTGQQRVPLPQPVLTTKLSIEILEVFPGDTYRDLALSELDVLGHIARGADVELAQRRAAAS